MKHLFIFYTILLNSLSYFSQTLSIPSKNYDYGVLQEGSSGEHDFIIKNIGNKDLEIYSALSSSSAVTIEFPKHKISPGSSSTIKVIYNTSRIGIINKSIQVNSNDPINEVVYLKISGEVKPSTNSNKNYSENYNDNLDSKLDDNKYKNGQIKFSGNKINGYYTTYYENGKKNETFYFEEGKKQGEYKKFYTNGSLELTGNYYNDVLNGVAIYYTKEQKIKAKVNFVNGNTEGLYEVYFSDGKIESTGNYSKNKKSGLWKYYYPNGQLESTGKYLNNLKVGIWVYYYENGKIKNQFSYINDDIDKHLNSFDENGNQIIKDGNGVLKSFYDSGGLMEKIILKDGRPSGVIYIYHENGQIESKITITSTKSYDIFDGSYVNYNDKGEVVELGNVVNGEPVKSNTNVWTD